MAKPLVPGAKGLAKKTTAQANKGLTGAARAAAAKTTGMAKKTAAPGQMKKTTGLKSAKTLTKGYIKKGM